jgi:hypothetical protein
MWLDIVAINSEILGINIEIDGFYGTIVIIEVVDDILDEDLKSFGFLGGVSVDSA